MNSPRTLDDLPYTEEMDQLYMEVRGEYPLATPRMVLHCLTNLRMDGRLPRKATSRCIAPGLAEQDGIALLAAVTLEVGSIGARDRLPSAPAPFKTGAT